MFIETIRGDFVNADNIFSIEMESDYVSGNSASGEELKYDVLAIAPTRPEDRAYPESRILYQGTAEQCKRYRLWLRFQLVARAFVCFPTEEQIESYLHKHGGSDGIDV